MSPVSVVKGVYEAFGRGDIERVLAAFDPRIEWRQAEGNPYEPSGKAWIGPAAVAENLFARIAADWEVFEVHPRTYHEAGATIVVEGRYTGTYKKTSKALDVQLCHVWSVRDGRVASFQQYVDTARLQDVMGAR